MVMQRRVLDHKQSIKEMLRHLVFKIGLYPVLTEIRKRRGYIVAHLGRSDTAARFHAIYKLGVWRNSNNRGSLSGIDSEVSATASVAKELPALITRLKCRRFLDVGCGDWNWMRNVTLLCDYIGVDVVAEVVAENKKFERPGVMFALVDAILGPLPKADLAFCREILFHLSFKDAFAVLKNIQVAVPWLVATTDTSVWFNSDIPTGDYRKINLERRPYCFPKPHLSIADDYVSKGRVLGLWQTSALVSPSGMVETPRLQAKQVRRHGRSP